MVDMPLNQTKRIMSEVRSPHDVEANVNIIVSEFELQ